MLEAELFCNKTLSCVILRQIAYNAIELRQKNFVISLHFLGKNTQFSV